MKIDFEMLKVMVAHGASAEVVIAMLEKEYERGEAKRKRDKQAKIIARASHKKRATKSDTERQSGTMEDDKRRQEATIDDTPRARLYREGSSALIALGRTERAARGLIAQWLKLTHDDDQLVLATILRGRDLAVADVAGWVLATLKGKTNGKSPRRNSLAAAADDLIARAESFEREGDFGGADDIGPIIEGGKAVGR
jgi:hypothetical protein